MPVTLQDVAKASGYSVPTVSRVLTGSTHPVSEKTRTRILETARALGYKPNLAARGLRTERTGVVGVLVNDIASVFAAQLVRGIQDELFPYDYTCLIVNSDGNLDIESHALEGLLQRPVDGIIFSEYVRMAHVAQMDALKRPSVFVHRTFAGQMHNSVISDDYEGARLAVRHLVQLGHTRIGYINGSPGWRASIQRERGWRDELEAHGLEARDIWFGQSDWDRHEGYAVTQQMLSKRERPTAIFAANDNNAVGAIYAAQDAGLHVPHDLAVVGFDNREITQYIRPTITTVELPVYEMGRAAAAILLGMMRGDSEPTEEVRILGKLYIRESCGAPQAQRTIER